MTERSRALIWRGTGECRWKTAVLFISIIRRHKREAEQAAGLMSSQWSGGRNLCESFSVIRGSRKVEEPSFCMLLKYRKLQFRWGDDCNHGNLTPHFLLTAWKLDCDSGWGLAPYLDRWVWILHREFAYRNAKLFREKEQEKDGSYKCRGRSSVVM